MSRDYSLDDFAGASGATGRDDETADGTETAGGADSDDTTGGGPPTGAGGESSADDGADVGDAEVAPARPTHAWSPDGEVCAACGGTARTRWRQDGAYVCRDCKEW